MAYSWTCFYRCLFATIKRGRLKSRTNWKILVKIILSPDWKNIVLFLHTGTNFRNHMRVTLRA